MVFVAAEAKGEASAVGAVGSGGRRRAPERPRQRGAAGSARWRVAPEQPVTFEQNLRATAVYVARHHLHAAVMDLAEAVSATDESLAESFDRRIGAGATR